jgi:mRNA export factor
MSRPQTPAEYNPNGSIEVSSPPSDAISQLAWSPKANHLIASSWDKGVRFWQVNPNGSTEPKASFQHEQPVLCCCWNEDGTRVFTGACDNKSIYWDLPTNRQTMVAQHDSPIKFVQWLPSRSLLMTGSWDKTIRYWDLRNSKPAIVTQLPERVYSADVRENLAIVATADKNVLVFNLNNPTTPYTTIQAPFKYHNRCVKTFPNMTGFAVGSVEGRVAIRHIEKMDQSKDFAFKCHRIKTSVYAVNDIAFHPLGTFATCGSDGTFHFWDKDSKQRLKQFKKCSLPISCCQFNAEGNIFAYAVCYDWHQGSSGYDPNVMKNHILLQQVGDEIKPRPRNNNKT